VELKAKVTACREILSGAQKLLQQVFIAQNRGSLADETSFVPCQTPFYNNISKSYERDGYLGFSHEIPSLELKNLYIRQRYEKIATIGLNSEITENPRLFIR
jgi:hypothetical protein